MIKTIVITIHGQESIGKNMAHLSAKLCDEEWMHADGDTAFINIRYTKLPTFVNCLYWARTMTAKYIASRLETICNENPGARIIVIAHSNGTRATRIAMDNNLNPKKRWPCFWIDDLILLGCPIKRNYEWSRHPQTEVLNFVSHNDWVVWAAKFYGMGTAGRNGFKYPSHNLRQIHVRWGHSGFVEQYPIISEAMRTVMNQGGFL